MGNKTNEGNIDMKSIIAMGRVAACPSQDHASNGFDRRYRDLVLASSALLSIGAMTPALAWAQASPAPAEAPATAAAPSGLAEIVVTARKTKENLLAVPLSISALSSADLQARGVTDYKNLQDYTPGFKFINQSVNRNDRGYTSFIMRGMNPGTPVSYAQGVTVFVDGSPVSGGIIDGMSDVDHVEVIKGPQSAYFGRSTFAGAVNFITQDPGFTPHAKVDATVKSFGTYDVTGEAEGPIWGEKLAGRIALRSYHTDGQYQNPENLSDRLGEQGTYSGTGQLLFKPTDRLTVHVYGKYFNDSDGPGATAWLYPGQYNCAAGAPTTSIQYVGGKNYFCGNLPAFTPNSMAVFTNVPQSVLNVFNGHTPALVSGVFRLVDGESDTQISHMGIERTGYNFHSSAHYALDGDYSIDANVALNRDNYDFLTDVAGKDLTGTVNPNYTAANLNCTVGTCAFTPTNSPGLFPQTADLGHGYNIDNDLSTEVRFNTPKYFNVIKGMVGVSYYHQVTRSSTTLLTNGGYAQVTPDNNNLASTPAVFGSFSWDLMSKLNLSFEGRYQWDTIESQQFRAALDYKATFGSFSPRVVLTYSFTPQTNVYLSYAEGTRPGIFNSSLNALTPAAKAAVLLQAPFQLAVPEEKVTTYEAGIKTRFMDNRAQILAAVYYGDWTGRHISDKVYYNDPVNPSVLDNYLGTIAGGETLIYGAELEGRFQATPAFLVEGTFDYAGTDIRKDYCGDCLLINGTATPTGTSMPGYPVTSASAAGTYTKTILGHDSFVRLEYLYTGVIYIDDSNIAKIAPSSKLNFHIGVNEGSYRIEFFGTNVTNTKSYLFGQRYSDSLPPAGSGISSALPVNEISASPTDKPMYGVRLTANF